MEESSDAAGGAPRATSVAASASLTVELDEEIASFFGDAESVRIFLRGAVRTLREVASRRER